MMDGDHWGDGNSVSGKWMRPPVAQGNSFVECRRGHNKHWSTSWPTRKARTFIIDNGPGCELKFSSRTESHAHKELALIIGTRAANFGIVPPTTTLELRN